MRFFIVVSVNSHRGRGKTDCDLHDLFRRKSIKLSIYLQFKIEKLLGDQPVLIFASDAWYFIFVADFHDTRNRQEPPLKKW
jgi:hypothetical protein